MTHAMTVLYSPLLQHGEQGTSLSDMSTKPLAASPAIHAVSPQFTNNLTLYILATAVQLVAELDQLRSYSFFLFQLVLSLRILYHVGPQAGRRPCPRERQGPCSPDPSGCECASSCEPISSFRKQYFDSFVINITTYKWHLTRSFRPGHRQ
jgi:hypothetical protein